MIGLTPLFRTTFRALRLCFSPLTPRLVDKIAIYWMALVSRPCIGLSMQDWWQATCRDLLARHGVRPATCPHRLAVRGAGQDLFARQSERGVSHFCLIENFAKLLQGVH